MTRVFHPNERGDEMVSWRTVAEENGRTVHAEMQFHAIATPAGLPVSHDDGLSIDSGDLPEREMGELAKILLDHTDPAEPCWFGVWDGYGQLHSGGAVLTYETRRGHKGQWQPKPVPSVGLAPDHIRSGPRVHAPGRDYFVLTGALSELAQARTMLGGQTPNIWWPQDRAWLVVTEIDFAWTYVAGPEALVQTIERSSTLEALRVTRTHRATIDADTINR